MYSLADSHHYISIRNIDDGIDDGSNDGIDVNEMRWVGFQHFI